MEENHLEAVGAFRSAAGDRFRRGPRRGEAVAAGLVEEVPCKDGWVVPVQAPVDAVPPVRHGPDVGLVHGSAAGIDEEDIRVGRCVSCFGPGRVLHSHTSCVNDRRGMEDGEACDPLSGYARHNLRFCSTLEPALLVLCQYFQISWCSRALQGLQPI